MGASHGKPIGKLTREEVAQAVNEMGKGYQVYCASMKRNGVDGSLLDSLTEMEMEETLDDLGITNRLHRRVLLKTLKMAKHYDDYHSISYEYSPETPSSTLEAYERVTTMCLQSNQETAVLAGVHLVLKNGNHLSLDTKLLQDGRLATNRLHVPAEDSICGKLVHDGSSTRRDYYKLPVPSELSARLFQQSQQQQGSSSSNASSSQVPCFTYTGHILKNEMGKRIGMVCMIDQCQPTRVEDEPRRNFLRQMALAVEYQLQLRKTLLSRQASLLQEQQQGREDQRDPQEQQLLQHHHKGDCCCENDRIPAASRSITLPPQLTQEQDNNNDDHHKKQIEKRPLPSSVTTSTAITTAATATRIPPPMRTPKFDTEQRFATLEAMGLNEIEPEDHIAMHLKNMVEMATQAFHFPYGEIIFQNNDSYFRIATISGSHELNDALTHMNQVVKRNPDGTPFLCKMLRASVIYKNSLDSAKTCVVHDLAHENNKTFPWLAAVSPIRSYVGSPILDATGKLKAILCLCDTKPRPDIDMAQEFQIEQFAKLVMQILENWALTRAIEDLEHGRQHVHDKTQPPRKREVTIVVTSIEGATSTTLWNSLSDAVQAQCQSIHNSVIQDVCTQHWGYPFDMQNGSSGGNDNENNNNNNELAFAFHDPVDAIGFAVDSQKALYEAAWPKALDYLPETEQVDGAFRGLRVKMGIHHGRVETIEQQQQQQRVTTTSYRGQTVSLAKCLCSTARGGQILTTFKTWDVASYFTGTNVGYPQVLDLGMHVIQMVGNHNSSHQQDGGGIETTRIVQLVPPNLAYDYFAARKLPSSKGEHHHHNGAMAVAMANRKHVSGRQFPPITSIKQVSASFHDAPYQNNKVTIAFVNMSAIDDRRASFLINLIGFLLDCEKEFGGYQCKKEMLVFHRPVDAVLFGLRLQEEVRHREPHTDDGGGTTSLANLIKFGCLHDYFVTMGPQRTTGRADYFGTAVNRAARLSSAATPGTICFGVVSSNNANSSNSNSNNNSNNDPSLGSFDRIEHPSIKTRFARKQKLKGIRDEFDLYECERVGYM